MIKRPNNKIIKIVLGCISAFLVLTLLFVCFVNRHKINLNNQDAKINYNNIYEYFPHQNIWIDENSIYYSRSLLVDCYYYLNQNGRTKITSDYMIHHQIDEQITEIGSYMQAYGDDIYFWGNGFNCNNNTDTCSGNMFLYHYSKEEKTFEKLLTVDHTVFEWAVLGDYVIFVNFANENLDKYLLYCGNLKSKEIKLISSEVVSFGIADNELRYITNGNGEYNCKLYSFDLKKSNSDLIASFNGKTGPNVVYNYTNEKLIHYNSQTLSVFDINSNKTESFELPDNVHYISCYENFAFVSTESYIYRVDLNSGKFEELYEHNGELMLINAINDKSAVIVCYKESLLRTQVVLYQVNSDGTVKKLFKG